MRMLERRWSKRELIFDQVERRYGIGHYEDRKRRLAITLDWLDKDEHADMEAIYSALKRALAERAEAKASGRAVDLRRLIDQHKRSHANLQRWAIKLRESYLQLILVGNPLGLEAIGEVRDMVESPNSVVDAITWLLNLMDDDPVPRLREEGPDRRSRAGHQPEPWLPRVRQELRRAGVPEGTEDELLIPVGLIPYRPGPSTQSP